MEKWIREQSKKRKKTVIVSLQTLRFLMIYAVVYIVLATLMGILNFNLLDPTHVFSGSLLAFLIVALFFVYGTAWDTSMRIGPPYGPGSNLESNYQKYFLFLAVLPLFWTTNYRMAYENAPDDPDGLVVSVKCEDNACLFKKADDFIKCDDACLSLNTEAVWENKVAIHDNDRLAVMWQVQLSISDLDKFLCFLSQERLQNPPPFYLSDSVWISQLVNRVAKRNLKIFLSYPNAENTVYEEPLRAFQQLDLNMTNKLLAKSGLHAEIILFQHNDIYTIIPGSTAPPKVAELDPSTLIMP